MDIFLCGNIFSEVVGIFDFAILELGHSRDARDGGVTDNELPGAV